MKLDFLSATDISRLLSEPEAVASIGNALRRTVEPEADQPRLFSPVNAGEFLLMPASSDDAVGLKVATISPDNPAQGFPKIQALYILFNDATLAPEVILDGSELTLIRTPATTVFAILELLKLDPRGPRSEIENLAVYGTGPQAYAHIRTLQSVVKIRKVQVRGRDLAKSTAFAKRVEEELELSTSILSDSTLGDSDVVICATSTTTPLFDGTLVAPNAIVASIGTHGLDAREVGVELLDRSDIVVEARAAALREYGDLIPAHTPEYWIQSHLPNLRELAEGKIKRKLNNVALYTGVGMAWQDLVIVTEIVRRHRNS